uniref:Uncharacterized mitochondrial protein AtMg00810-like n=1 Tax=Nicotiana tabacum TaxID=4097 RepID=A0A1S4AU29_TOBAC|nr:PREDICTED: uncharacterized mitochondrial protein AtMg00810-like [Nicotiana tabacum]
MPQTGIQTVKFKAYLKAGFSQNTIDYSMFIKRSNGHIVVILIYVDDRLLTGSSKILIDETKVVLHQEFKVKDLGKLRYFLGIEVMRSKHGILLHQRKYTVELISKLGLSASKSAITPLEINQRLTSVEFDKVVRLQNLDPLVDVTSYQKIIGKLLYFTVTRPEICYAVRSRGQSMQAPKRSHMDATTRVARYFKNASGLGVLLKRESSQSLLRFCDLDWVSALLLEDQLVAWLSNRMGRPGPAHFILNGMGQC